MQHPPEETLLRFAFGVSTRQENQQVVRHLLARCPSCAATVRRLCQEPPQYPEDAYDQALDRFAERLRELTRPPSPTPSFLGLDPEDLLDPEILLQEAGRHLRSALATVEEISRTLRGESPPPREFNGNVLPFPAQPRNLRRGCAPAEADVKPR